MVSVSRDDLPIALYDAAQVGALDRRLIHDGGAAGFDLMDRAARAVFSALRRRWPEHGRIHVLCGAGNNGGDGFLVAKHALEAGCEVVLNCLASADAIVGDAGRAVAVFRAAGGEIQAFEDDAPRPDVVVDAVFGTGLNRDVEGRFAEAIEWINAAAHRGTKVVAVDIPSGLDAGSGRIWGRAVRADFTLTFIGLKIGLLTGAGPSHSGEVLFDDLGAPAALYRDQPVTAYRVGAIDVERALAPRARSSHKGDNGHILCIGGTAGMGGSIRMSAEAALRCGAGLVSVACHPDHAGAMSQARPELMCRGVGAHESIGGLIEAADVIAIGPGLGGDDWGESLWSQAWASDRVLLVDADGLNRLARSPRARGRWILTPHPGEAARLLACSTAEVVNDRVAAVRALAERFDAVVVLKGAGTLVAGSEMLWLCAAGNPGMAVGGMGDVLTGVIAALIGQGLSLIDAARIGVEIHARAGDAAAAAGGERGLLPSDLFTALRAQVNPAPA